jgi:hypothetical protein
MDQIYLSDPMLVPNNMSLLEDYSNSSSIAYPFLDNQNPFEYYIKEAGEITGKAASFGDYFYDFTINMKFYIYGYLDYDEALNNIE